MEGKIGVKFWHSGVFKTDANGKLVYEGGLGKTKHIDPDLLSYFDIIELGKECCGGKDVLGVCYLIPGMTLSNGLRKVDNDDDMLEIAALGKRFRVVDIYLYHGMNSPELEPLEPASDDPHFQPVTQAQASECTSKPSKHKKTKPKRGPPTALIPVRSSPRTKKATESILNPKGTTTSKKQLADIASSTSLLKQSVPSSLHTSSQLSNKITHTTKESPDLHFERHKTPQITQKEPYLERQKQSQPVDETYEWEDNRPESPLKLHQLIDGYDSDQSDEVDPSYDPFTDKGKTVARGSGKGCVDGTGLEGRPFFGDVYTDEDSSDEDGTGLEGDGYEEFLGTGLEGLGAQLDDEYEEAVLNGGELYDSDVSDEEYFAAIDRVKACTSHLVQVAADLAKEAVEGKTCVENQEEHALQSHTVSCEDEETPPPSDDDEGTRDRRSGLLVSPTTDFSKFTWKVGLRFAKRDDFKEAVAKYAVFQGKNLVITNSNKNRQQRIGVKCIKGCPFTIYASWHTGKAAILVKRVCSQHTCRKWDMLGIPCCHAVACIYFLNEDAEDYVDACYSRTTYLKAYAGSIPPMEGERYWPRVIAPLDPPPIKIGPGRPCKNRIKDPFENPKKPGSLTKTGIEMTCSVCKAKNHNKRKCPYKEAAETPSEPPSKKPRGRPRKDGEATQTTVSKPPSTPSTAPEHHSMTAQPTLLGRSGRAIRGGVGARGGQQPPSGRGRGQSVGSGTGQGRGGGSRGGRSRGGSRGRGVPVGVGVFIAEDGSAHTSGRVTTRSRRPLSEQALK